MRQRSRLVFGVLIVLTLALASMGASCGSHPRHTAIVSLNAFSHALDGVQQGEAALYLASKISSAQHADFTAKLFKVATLADDANNALIAWQPGQPVPAQLGPLMDAVQVALRDTLATFALDPATQTKITDVYAAIADILKLMAGR